MYVTLTLDQLKETLAEAASVAVATYIKAEHPADDAISQREAWKVYGRQRVTEWREKGLLSANRNSSSANGKLNYSKAELASLDAAERLRPLINVRDTAEQAPRQYTFGIKG